MNSNDDDDYFLIKTHKQRVLFMAAASVLQSTEPHLPFSWHHFVQTHSPDSHLLSDHRNPFISHPPPDQLVVVQKGYFYFLEINRLLDSSREWAQVDL